MGTLRVAVVAVACILPLQSSEATASASATVGHPVDGVVALISASTPTKAAYHGYMCGAVVIGPRELLTAAHCVADRRASSVMALVGADNLCAGTPVDGRRVAITRIVVHPDYDAVTGRFDLATLTLGERLVAGAARPPAAAASVTEAVALGWGSSSMGGAASCRLTWTHLDVLGPDRCAVSIEGARHFDEASMLCARPREAGADTCSGDSGGPLIALDGDASGSLVGIVSWGYGCDGSKPGAYARASVWHPP